MIKSGARKAIGNSSLLLSLLCLFINVMDAPSHSHLFGRAGFPKTHEAIFRLATW
jgi:hypothetical protein